MCLCVYILKMCIFNLQSNTFDCLIGILRNGSSFLLGSIEQYVRSLLAFGPHASDVVI